MASKSSPIPSEPLPTRDRLIAAMLKALRSKGYHGVGLNELLHEAGAPKGVLYHHFPGGKSELAIAAIDAVVDQISAAQIRLLQRHSNPVDALGAWMSLAQKLLASSGFEQGCPLATIALESTPDDVEVRQALALGFARIREPMQKALERAGIEARRAGRLAALIVSAYEGALLQARVAGRVDTMQDTVSALVDMVHLSLPET